MPEDPWGALAQAEPAWVVGPITWDLFGERRVPGGALSYIGQMFSSVGVQGHFLALGGADAPFEALVGHSVRRVEAETLTFRHASTVGTQGERRLLMLEQAAGRTVEVGDAPSEWAEPSTLILAPLMPEDVDVLAFIDEYPGAEVALLAQGLQRAVLPDESRTIAERAQPSSVLLDALRPNVSVFLSRDEVALWPAGTLDYLAARAARVVVTDGARGASIVDRSGTRSMPAAPADAVDTTGAGDVFAAAFILGLRAGEQFAGRLAAAYAAAAVEVVGPASLPSRSAIEARLPQPDRGHLS